jgi:hypothetical protein
LGRLVAHKRIDPVMPFVQVLSFCVIGLCDVIFILDKDLVVVRIGTGYGIIVICGFLVDLLLDFSASRESTCV